MVIKKIDKAELESLVYELQDLIEVLENSVSLFDETTPTVEEIEDEIDHLENYMGVSLNHNYPFEEVDLKENLPTDLINCLVQVEKYFSMDDIKNQLTTLFKHYVKVINED